MEDRSPDDPEDARNYADSWKRPLIPSVHLDVAPRLFCFVLYPPLPPDLNRFGESSFDFDQPSLYHASGASDVEVIQGYPDGT